MPFDAVSEFWWRSKYQLCADDGTPIDGDIEATWRRVARALAAVEKCPQEWEGKFYDAMVDFKFLPAGRILAGAGSRRQVTLFNCYVMGTIEDSMDGIFTALRESALTLRQGGGIGVDFSTIRPSGAVVHGVGAKAKGPLYFADVWDAMSLTMHDAHNRRGAQMAVLRCDHPDIFDFIKAKRTKGRLTQFNMSVLATDAFMDAVANNTPWELKFNGVVARTVPAVELWDAIMKATYEYAEPGIIWIDRVNRENNLWYCEEIKATNPCGEIPQGPYSPCLLGSINLAAFVCHPFYDKAYLDIVALRDVVAVAVRMMDNVNDVSNFPLPQQREMALAKRRLGLGVTGLADALMMCDVKYGSSDAIRLTEGWMGSIEESAYLASAWLAKEKGAFPLYDVDLFTKGERFQRLPNVVQDTVKQFGLRNSHLTAIAPTGTISLLAGNLSGGVEPIFNPEYNRTVLQGDGSRRDEPMVDFGLRVWRGLGNAGMPPAMVGVNDLTWQQHVAMQAAAQKHVDNSISKTVNLPASVSFDEFKSVYTTAYAAGCKSCTTYRPNDIIGAVLTVGDDKKSAPDSPPPLRARPPVLHGRTYKLHWAGQSMYVTINDEERDGKLVPLEVFITSKNVDAAHWISALTRTISAVMRRDTDFSFLPGELKQVYSARGGEFIDGKYMVSEVALIGDVLDRHFRDIGYITPNDDGEAAPLQMSPVSGYAELGRQCPDCGQPTLIRSEGCDKCLNCSYSRCG